MLYLSSEEVKSRIKDVLTKYNLPTLININNEELYQYISLDKKRSGNYLSIVYFIFCNANIIKSFLSANIKDGIFQIRDWASGIPCGIEPLAFPHGGR